MNNYSSFHVMSGQKIIASAINTVTDNLNVAKNSAGFEQLSAVDLIPGAIKVVLGSLGIIAIGLIIYSGFLYLTSQGNKEPVEKAKKILTYAIIGMVVIIASYAISGYLLGVLSSIITA